MHRALFLLIFLAAACASSPEQSVESIGSEIIVDIESVEKIQPNHIRGLFMVDDEVAWASGAGGTFMRTVDALSWSADTIAGYTHLDFRDVHAFDAETAILMAAGSEGRILRTEDGGTSWMEVYTNLDSGIFLDGIDFFGDTGYCYGDPMKESMFVLKTDDAGRTWSEEEAALPPTLAKEAGFAASGTGVIASELQTWIATGGDSIARVFRKESGNWSVYETPMRSAEGCGIFSFAHIPPSTLVAVGGCYLDSTSTDGNCAVSNNNGKTWTAISENGPRGYRSCVAYSKTMDLLVACGRTGVDVSRDRGLTWEALSDEGYYTCSLADSTGWLMGKRGKLARLSFAE